MPAYNLSKLSILLVENHRHMRRLLHDVLLQLGVELTHETNNFRDAFEIFKEHDPDLILTSWSPGLDALKFLYIVRRGGDTPNPYVPVIVLTAHTEAKHVYMARDAGMTEFLAKPVSATLLYYRIRSIIEKNRIFVRSNKFFGPDRRRRRLNIPANDRRNHFNVRGSERRVEELVYGGAERRQGYPGHFVQESRQAR